MTDNKKPDWNDLHREHGTEGARETFDEAITGAWNEQDYSGSPSADDGKTAPKVPVLRSYFVEELERQPVEPVDWLVPDFIPHGAVTGLFGDGATGKDLLLFMLATAATCERYWLGKEVKQGPVIYINVEDDDKELNRRRAAIAEHHGLRFADFPGRLKIVPLAGKDTILAAFDHRAGVVRPRPLLQSIRNMIEDFKPVLVIVGNRVNIFGVNQNDDAQARQCVGLLTGIATDFQITVIMPGHVSLAGKASGEGSSGSVQWSNGPRARLYLHRVVDDEDGVEADADARLLEVKKANWGPSNKSIELRWSKGVFVVPDHDRDRPRVFGEVADMLAAEDEFLRLLDLVRFNVCASPTAPNNAPKVFVDDHRCALRFRNKGGKRALKTAMERLLDKGTIEVEEFGPPSHRRNRIVCVRQATRTEAPVDSEPQAPANGLYVVGPEPDHPCIQCNVNDGKVYLIRYNFGRDIAAKPLHEHCAPFFFKLR